MNAGKGFCGLAAASLSLLAVTAHAERHGVAAKAGMLGLGVEYTYSATDLLSFRVGLNGSKLGFDSEESGIDYEFDFVWESFSAAVDVHPLRGSWRVSAGVLRNDNRLDAVAQPNGTVTVGGQAYDPDDIGRLTGRAVFDDTAPFLSLGWDWSKRKRFGVSFDLGVVEQGAPTVALAADGPIASQPAFQDNVEQERLELQESLDDFDVLPFATLGVVFRF